MDLDSSDFKSNESFFKKDSPDQKSGFGFAERNAKSVLRSKIRFWIHRKERTLRFTLTPNGKREFVPRDQVFPLFFVYRLLLLHKNK